MFAVTSLRTFRQFDTVIRSALPLIEMCPQVLQWVLTEHAQRRTWCVLHFPGPHARMLPALIAHCTAEVVSQRVSFP